MAIGSERQGEGEAVKNGPQSVNRVGQGPPGSFQSQLSAFNVGQLRVRCIPCPRSSLPNGESLC